jgi:hypothetical protein
MNEQKMRLPPELEGLLLILQPRGIESNQDAAARNIRFVHYTRADAAMNILPAREVWMRQTSCMNDYSEIQYGLTLLRTTYNSNAAGAHFQNSLNKIHDGITKTIEEQFNRWVPVFAIDTYLTCFSEHLDTEDMIGRLSMWRAYGNPTGIALVINNAVLLDSAPGVNVYSSPVAYLRAEEFEAEFGGHRGHHDPVLDRDATDPKPGLGQGTMWAKL